MSNIQYSGISMISQSLPMIPQLSSIISESNSEILQKREINQTFVLLYMFTLLKDYDENNKASLNPYVDDIMMKTQNGKFVPIPKDMQIFAIAQWNKMKNKQFEQSVYEVDTDDDDRACISCRKESKEKNKSIFQIAAQIVLCILIIITILYVLSSLRKTFIKFEHLDKI